MKVLHVSKIIGIAGTENYLISLLPSLVEEGIEIEFLSLTPLSLKGQEELFNKTLEQSGIKVTTFYYRFVPSLPIILKIFKLIRQGNFDLIHTHLIHADSLLAIVKLFLLRGLKIVSTKHGYEETYTNRFGFDAKHRKYDRYYLTARLSEALIDRSHAISQALSDFYLGMKICQPKRLEIIRHGFDLPMVEIDPNTYRFAPLQLVIVGRLIPFKGHRYAIRALPHLIKEFPELKLVLVGSGFIEDELRQMVKDHKVEENVVFTGFQPNARDYMFCSDLVLVPSVAEGFGIVVIEAFSLKKPVVSFDVSSLNEHVLPEETGLLAKPFDEEDFAEKIKVFLKDEAYRLEIGERAYQKQTSYFSMSRLRDETIAFYHKALRNTPKVAPAPSTQS